MRRSRFPALAWILLLASAARGGEGLEPLVAGLRQGDPQAKQRLIEAGPAAVARLAALAADRDARVGWAARSVLRRIAVRAGDDTARRKAIYDALLPSIDPRRPLPERRAAVEVLGLVGDGSQDQVRPLARLVLHDPALARDAVVAIGRMGEGGMGALTCLVWHNGSHLVDDEPIPPPVKPELKALALEIYASQPIEDSGRPDVTLDFLRDAADSEHEAIRVAALKALGRWGHPAAVPLLLDAIEKGTPPVKMAAIEGLLLAAATRLRAGEGDAAGRLYAQALDLAAADGQRAAALAGLARIGAPAWLPAIRRCLKAKAPAVQQAACAALARVRGPAGLEAMLDALADAPDEAKPMLIAAIGARRDPTASRPLLEAAKARDEAIALAAVRALGNDGGPAAVAPLLDLAEKGRSADIKAAALGAALRLAHRQADRGQAAVLTDFGRALRLAGDDADRAEALRGIAKTGDPRALELLRPILADAASPLREAAAQACLAIGEAARASGDRRGAVSAFTAVADAEPTQGLATQAVKQLHSLGVHHGLDRRDGAIATWWIIGPFDCRDMNAAKAPQFPERELRFDKTYKVGDRVLRWRLHHSRHPKGWVDCRALFKPCDRVLAYAYTELAADAEREVELHLGRDDGLSLWLNGQLLYNEHTPHGVEARDFVVRAKLVAGINRFLVKSSQGGGGWAFYLRITDADGRPFGARRR